MWARGGEQVIIQISFFCIRYILSRQKGSLHNAQFHNSQMLIVSSIREFNIFQEITCNKVLVNIH